MKNTLSKFLLAILLISLAIPFASCAKKVNTEALSIHTEKQEAYLNDSYVNFSKYASGTDELSKPKPITIDIPSDYLSGGSKLYVSENSDLSNSMEYDVASNKIEIYNLKIATTYYYQIKNDSKTSETKSFKVDDKGPRNIYVDGVTNFRDVGGWKTSDGTYVNQGLLYRSSKFNDDESTELLITEAGINTVINDLKIKTEIDLRTTTDNENGGITSSPIGDSVKYISMPFKSGGNYLTLNKDKLKSLFEILGDENNYPIVFHCSIGTDRTGVVAFFVNALLGVSEEDLYRDYLFSNFGNIGSMRTPATLKDYINALNIADGKTLSEKAFNYLLMQGVSEENINNVIRIMTK